MKRGLYNAHAVILNSLDFGESDRILSFYTLEHGKIKGIAKGARRSKRRFVGNLDPLSNVKLIYFHSEKSELVRVEDCNLIEPFQNLKADIDRLSVACYLLELVSEMTREGQVLPPIYQTLVTFLRMLDAGCDDSLARFFEIKLLSILGYLPYLNGCVVCKEPGTGEARIYFSSDKGGLVCRRCSAGLNGLIPVSPGTVGLLTMALKFEVQKLGRLKPGAAFLEESERLLYDFIKFQIGKELKTKKFMAKMRSAQA